MAPLNWSRDQSLVAFSLYWRLPFGRFHSNNPEIIKYAALIQRTPSALAMKLSNIASLDPAILMTGRSGLKAASKMDKALWQEMQQDWHRQRQVLRVPNQSKCSKLKTLKSPLS